MLKLFNNFITCISCVTRVLHCVRSQKEPSGFLRIKLLRNPVSAETPWVSKAIGETPHICEFKLLAIIRLIQTGRLTYSNLIGLISVNIPSAIALVFRWPRHTTAIATTTPQASLLPCFLAFSREVGVSSEAVT